MMLTLTFLGVGNAFAKRSFQSNALLEAWATAPEQQPEPDATLLIDFGTTGPQALHQLKEVPGFGYLKRQDTVDYSKIGYVFITHQHGNHIGGLEELALLNMFAFAGVRGGLRPQLLSSPEILENLWEHSLKGGLGVIHGRAATLEDYFVSRPVRTDVAQAERFTWAGRYELQPFVTDHVRLGAKYDWPSLGLLIRDGASRASVFFSGDTGFDFEAYGEMMGRARLCFHEVHLGDEELAVHSSLSQLRTLPEAIKKKTYLYHYSDDWDCGRYEVVQQEFAGFARPFHRYVLFD
ncbi:MAG: MBL fold metallo-hydrolase [Planctomycetota bacterium]